MNYSPVNSLKDYFVTLFFFNNLICQFFFKIYFTPLFCVLFFYDLSITQFFLLILIFLLMLLL